MINLHERREAEQAVIGSIVIDQRALKKVSSILSAEDFTVPVHIALFEAAVDIDERGKAFDPVIAIDIAKTKLGKEAGEYVVELARITPTSSNVMAYAEIVRKYAGLRRIREAVGEVLLGDDPEKMAGDIAGISQEYLRTNRTGRIKTISDSLKAFYDKLSQKITDRIDTGLSKVDWLLKGMFPGNLIVIAARPKAGKSALALQIARYAAYKGNKTILFSLEMGEEEVTERLVSRSGIDMDKLIDNDLSPDDWKQINAAAVAISKLPLKIVDEPNMSVARIRGIVRSEPDTKLIVIDYLQLMQATKRRENRNLEIGDITAGLKILASELRIPIILLSQLNRGKSDTEKPEPRDLRDSGSIEQDLNKLIMLWKLDELPDGAVKVGCSVELNRRGRTGVRVLRFDGAHMMFTELEERYEPPKRRKGVFDD